MAKTLSYNEKAVELKWQMDKAIGEYIAFCTMTDATDVDYSYINQDIDDAIGMLDGVPAREAA